MQSITPQSYIKLSVQLSCTYPVTSEASLMAKNKIPGSNPDQFCTDIKPTDKVQFFTDSKTPGLRLRIKPTGSKSWIYGYSAKIVPGKYSNRTISLGPFKESRASASHALTVKQARDRALELRSEVKTGGDPATP